MKGRRCRRRRGEIALHVAGDLPPRRAARLERHLAACPGCRELARRLEADRRSLARLATEALDPNALARIRGGVLERVAELEASRRGAAGLLGLPRRTSWALAALAAVLLAAGLLLAMGLALWPHGPRPSKGPATVSSPAPAAGPAAGRAQESAPGASTPPAPTPPPAAEERPTPAGPAARPPRIADAAPPAASREHHGPARTTSQPRAAAPPEPSTRTPEPLVIQMVSEQPDIVYYWLAEPQENTHDSTSD